MEKKSAKTKKKSSKGSALILAVVLTSLLAIVGATFIMLARVNRISTESIVDIKELNTAVDTVIARISQELLFDMPNAEQEYYDYPDINNPWLASLEPYYDGSVYRWQQISDVTDYLANPNIGQGSYATVNVPVKPPDRTVIKEYPKLSLTNNELDPISADADGDGIADSKWIQLHDGFDSGGYPLYVTTSKAKPIYAAIRIIDNCAMLNVNTAYEFDPCVGIPERVDGSRQTQINLRFFARNGDTIEEINAARNPNGNISIIDYPVWQPQSPNSVIGYIPFDLSDELELRYRFCISSRAQTRLKGWWNWNNTVGLDFPAIIEVPYDTYTTTSNPLKNRRLIDWYLRFTNPYNAEFDTRHVLTTRSMDRTVAANGFGMVNVNNEATTAGQLYSAVRAGLIDANPNITNSAANAISSQLAANIKDYVDDDEIVTSVVTGSNTYVGFERPCVYLAELAAMIYLEPIKGKEIRRSYSIKLYKPYGKYVNGWHLNIDIDDNGTVDIDKEIVWSGSQKIHIMQWIDPCAPLIPADFTEPAAWYRPVPEDGAVGVNYEDVTLEWEKIPGSVSYDIYLSTDDSDFVDGNDDALLVEGHTDIFYDASSDVAANAKYYWWVESFDGNDNSIYDGQVWSFKTASAPAVAQPFDNSSSSIIFDNNSVISLRRPTAGTVDFVTVAGDWSTPTNAVHAVARDTGPHKCIRKIWLGGVVTEPNLMLQADPRGKNLTNIGELGMVFRVNAYNNIGPTSHEDDIRLDLADPRYQQIFKYLTVMAPPAGHGAGDKVYGRININTAPWYVIAQLPWMNEELAQAIVAYRDKTDSLEGVGIDYKDTGRRGGTGRPDIREYPGFASIGELANVINKQTGKEDYDMRYYILGTDNEDKDLEGYPDITPGGTKGDMAEDDFEERDVIFSRISNLVTVRSDSFTAYILVRIGVDGPQKRVIALLERDSEGVKVKALQPVADPR